MFPLFGIPWDRLRLWRLQWWLEDALDTFFQYIWPTALLGYLPYAAHVAWHTNPGGWATHILAWWMLWMVYQLATLMKSRQAYEETYGNYADYEETQEG